MSVARLKRRLEAVEEQLRPRERKHRIVFVSDKTFPPGLYGAGEEPLIPKGHVRVYLGEEFVDLPEEQVNDWLVENVDANALVIWL